ncbi:C2H2-type domain-containing protein [Caenorhabditis elegans]|uniref:C2H2-type domain-containing protein n=2 Tax=Caenorhabditis elegans TaxID=6239 RepID=Q0PCD8_CAEEL|nr:C2H2-type domain-containing protein [Caenorhabditis elegans]CCD68098.1 C2H2-type domain-containing protein [Caenorhabditis elegans]|eukprot:NP_001076598.1 Transcription factor che-1 [Caenorhabditis elegans]
MSYHYQMNNNNTDFFDSANYIPQMQMHHGYQDFYASDSTSSMPSSGTTQQALQQTENGIIQGQNGSDHGAYGGWRQHDWNSTSSWSIGNQLEMENGTLTMSHGATNDGNIRNNQQMMTSNHITTDSFRQIPPSGLCYMDPTPSLRLPKKEPLPVQRPMARSTPKPFRCQTCGKAFSQAANLTAHKRIHTGEKPFMCPVCNRPFSQSSSLVTHRRTHTGERPYPCAQCEKAFTDSSTLTKHLRTHTGHKPYVCSICMMKFTQSGNLHRHMKTHK